MSSSLRILAAALAASVVTAAPPSPPHILFLMMDQVRFDALGYVQPAANTPNMNALAADGVAFTSAYSATPTCTPARSAILTGLSPWYHGMLGYGSIAPQYPYEIARALAAGGYYTAAVGKNHFIYNTNFPPTHGYNTSDLYDGIGSGLNTSKPGDEFDVYDAWFQTQMPGANPVASGGLDWNSWRGAPYIYNESLHPSAWTGRTAAGFIANYTREEPLFLKVSFHRPHSPYDPPPRVLNATPASSLPPIYAGSNWDAPFKGPGNGCGPTFVDAWCGEMPADEAELARRAYHANIAFVDENVGVVIDALKAKGWWNNTFVIFAGDHGDGQGDHYHWRKGYPYEFSAHVPMLFRWPPSYSSTLPRNSTSALVTELRDILPTVLDIAGIVPPQGTVLDGLPLTCILQDPTGSTCTTSYTRRSVAGNQLVVEGEGEEASPLLSLHSSASSAPDSHHFTSSGPWRQWIDMEHDIVFNNSNHWNGLTDGKTKYVFNADFPTEQLFNLTADPYEMVDLVHDGAYAPLLEQWRARLVAQFTAEGRGDVWVKNGELQMRNTSQLYSPHYPGGIEAAPPGLDWRTM